MAFKSPRQRAMYFEMLKNQGKLNLGKQSPMGMPPAMHNNIMSASPAMAPKMNQPMIAPIAPNPMVPLNPAGGNRFGRLKKFI